MSFNPDDVLEKWVMRLAFMWGPFYALFYILRLIWKELIERKEE